MGASGWSYFVPFQEDVSEALKSLRWEVFRSGEFMKPSTGHPLPPFKDFVPPDPDIWEVPEELENWKAMYEQAKSQHAQQSSAPTSPDEALAQGDTEGTHSIIDIVSISSTTSRGESGTLTPETLLELFGSTNPTRAMLEAANAELQVLRGRWMCTYIFAYEGETPTEIFFTGFSGD